MTTARVVYAAICSLDGYVEDAEGKFDWAAPGEELHQFVNDLERTVGTHLYGRRMYETMAVWETDEIVEGGSPAVRDYARVWRDADKVVYSRTLEEVSSTRTRLEREFDPEAVRSMKAGAERSLSVGGAELAAEALRAGLVDEVHLFVMPIIVGGGKRALPDGLRLELELLDERRFASGAVHLNFRIRA